MINKLVGGMTPPLMRTLLRKCLAVIRRQELFDGDGELFCKTVVEGKVYGEYGCGLSTAWVARNVGCHIYSVDSSKAWISRVGRQCGDISKINLHYVNVGEIGDWGRPLGYEYVDEFVDYTDWIWSQSLKPNIVLIDGRFRVCCFLTSLLKADEGTKIFFDDYTIRTFYHYVEKFIKPVDFCGRQALFVVEDKDKLDYDALRKAIDRFRFVLE